MVNDEARIITIKTKLWRGGGREGECIGVLAGWLPQRRQFSWQGHKGGTKSKVEESADVRMLKRVVATKR